MSSWLEQEEAAISEDCVDAVDMDERLAPFLAAMGGKTRRQYLRGILGPCDRKSLQPVAERLGLSGHEKLQYFIASPAWDDAPFWIELARQADQMLGGPMTRLACAYLQHRRLAGTSLAGRGKK